MEKITFMSQETKRVMDDNNWRKGSFTAGYKTDNGAEVFIYHDKNKPNKYGYAAEATVLVVKDSKILSFSVEESVGNSSGTIFTRASVGGLENRSDIQGSPDEGMYGYASFTKEEQQEGDDILTRAVKIYERYEKETNGQVAIGTAFKTYVPHGSIAKTKQYFIDKEEAAKKAQKEAMVKAHMEQFKNHLNGF